MSATEQARWIKYWEQRERDRETTEKMSDQQVSERMKLIIDEHMKRIQRDVESFYLKYADESGITNAEAKKLIDNLEMEEYERLAEYYVKNKHDKDIAFTEEANKQMKLYNVTMKINREKLILAHMAEHLTNMGYEVEAEMKDYLDSATRREFERQAGLLGSINLSKRQFEAIINSTHLSDKKIWSERLWGNVAGIQHEVDKVIKDSLLRGRHPDESVGRIMELSGRTEFEARRLLITETTRAQSEAQLLSFKEKKLKSFIFIAQIDSRTTRQCRSKHKKIFSMKEAKIGLNIPPLHQFCRSSVAPNINPDDVVEEGGGVFNLFDDDNQKNEDWEEESGSDDGSLDELENLLDQIEKKTGTEKKPPKKKTQKKPDNKQIDKVIEQLEKQKEPEPLKPVLNDQIRSKMSDKHIEQAEKMLTEAPEIAQKVWLKYSDRISLNRTDEKGAHFDPTYKRVNLSTKQTFDEDGEKKPAGDTFFHEFAHFIDDLAYRDHRLGRWGHYTQHFYSEKHGKTWEDVMQKEINDLINARNREFKKQYEAGELKHFEADMSGGKWKKSYTYELLEQEFRKVGVFETSAFSDIFSGVTKNKLRIYWGHRTSYWKAHGNKVAFEAFANLFGAIMTSAETYQMAKETIPDTVEVFEELLIYLAGEGEEQ